MELDMGKLSIPQTNNPLRRPDISPRAHTHTKLIKAILNCLPQLPLNGLSHFDPMERECSRAKPAGANTNNAASRMF